MVRIDMSEYMEKHAVARLIGAPPGYVGYDEGGALTEAIRRRPYQVILFDEVEKAHPDVFNVLLQVLDDGRLTDGQGRTVDFRNALIVLTSNLGSDILAAQPAGQDSGAVRNEVMEVVRAAFRPEFLNRLDEVILFHRLNRDHMGGIVEIQLRRLEKLLADRQIRLEMDESAKAWIADKGYDPAYGARPLKAGDPALPPKPAGWSDPGRKCPRRRGDNRDRRRGRPGHQRDQGGSGGVGRSGPIRHGSCDPPSFPSFRRWRRGPPPRPWPGRP